MSAGNSGGRLRWLDFPLLVWSFRYVISRAQVGLDGHKAEHAAREFGW